MPDETDDREETTNELDSKPTITIAEKQAGSAGLADKPTITIAEKDDGE
ncbi:MAG: hypothetical protein ABI857_01720 [Acidobacteriota bacterium]